MPPAPGAPPPPPPGPDAQLEYVRNRFCEFGPSFAVEKTTTASPADLVVAVGLGHHFSPPRYFAVKTPFK
jgi:hypothetical protein